MSRISPAQAVVQPAGVAQTTLQSILWTGVTVSLLFYVFRIWVRIKVFHRLFIDDAFVLAAWLMAVGYAAIWQWCGDQLYLSVAVSNGKLSRPPPDFLNQLRTFLVGLLVAYLMFYTCLWSIKISFLLFFMKLGNNMRRQRILWWTVLAFTIASYSVCLGLMEYKCHLGPDSEITTGCYDAEAITYNYFTLRFATFLDIITDVCIIIVSTNILWNLQISKRKKFALAGIFSLTVFIISVSIARVVIATSGPQLDLTWLLLWGGIEITVAIIVACLASFRTLYTRSERSSHRPSGKKDFSDGSPNYRSRDRFIPLKNRNVDTPATSIGEKSAASLDELVYPVDAVHVGHDFIMSPVAESRHAGH